MKIKYYKIKANGNVALTPTYHDKLDKAFCAELLGYSDEELRYQYPTETLYVMLKNVLTMSNYGFGILMVNNKEMSFEELKTKISTHLCEFRSLIRVKQLELGEQHKKYLENYRLNLNSLHFVAYELESYVERYKDIHQDLLALDKDEIIRKVEQDDENGEMFSSDYKRILDDITPITL